MSEKEALEYLEGELGYQIANFNASRKFYLSSQRTFTLVTTGLSAATTVLIGVVKIEPEIADWWLIFPLVFSAAITLLTAYEGFLRPKELWVQKTDTWTSLINLSSRIKYAKKKSNEILNQKDIDEFYNAFEEILLNEHRLWMAVRTGSVQEPKRSITPGH